MFDLWFTDLMYVSGFPHGATFSNVTFAVFLSAKPPSESVWRLWLGMGTVEIC